MLKSTFYSRLSTQKSYTPPLRGKQIKHSSFYKHYPGQPDAAQSFNTSLKCSRLLGDEANQMDKNQNNYIEDSLRPLGYLSPHETLFSNSD